MAQDSPEKVKAVQAQVKTLMQQGQYDKAIKLLKTLNHPKRADWVAQVEARRNVSGGGTNPARAAINTPAYQTVRDVDVPAPKIGMERTFRWIWGILTLLSLAWMCYGVSISGQAFNAVVSTPVNTQGMDAETAEMAEAAGFVGAGLGAGLGMTFFMCSGIPFFLLFLILYWRNGVAINRKREHAQTLRALSSR